MTRVVFFYIGYSYFFVYFCSPLHCAYNGAMY